MNYEQFYEMAREIVIMFLQKEAYDWYLPSWQAEHDEGEPACFDEFCDCEFCDEDCMRALLSDELYWLWDKTMYNNRQQN